jgi:hypothetical protein
MRGGTVRVIRRRVAALLLGLVAAATLGGCHYLFGLNPSVPPDFGMPKPAATYKSGHATVTVDKQPAQSGTAAYFSPAYLTIDRIVGTQHWTTLDSSRCVVTVTKADETGLAGTATCKGLRWSDALSMGLGSSFQPPYISGEPAFDAEVTFEATPSNARVG